MTRVSSLVMLIIALLAAPLAAEAQPTGKIYRIGWLSADRNPAGDDAFQRGLRDLGWVEGQNVITEYRVVQGGAMRPTGALGLAADLADLKVDVIVAIGGPTLPPRMRPARFRSYSWCTPILFGWGSSRASRDLAGTSRGSPASAPT